MGLVRTGSGSRNRDATDGYRGAPVRRPGSMRRKRVSDRHRPLLRLSKLILAILLVFSGQLSLLVGGFGIAVPSAAAAVSPSGTAIHSPQTFYAYVGSGENVDVTFTKAGDAADGGDVTITVHGPGGVVETCTTLDTDPSGSSCSWSDLTAPTAGVWQIDFSHDVTNGDTYTWDIEVQNGTTSIPGRVYSELYEMSQFSGAAPANFSLWYQSKEGFLYQATYSDYHGINSQFSSDAAGVANLNTCVSAYESMDTTGPNADTDRLWVPPPGQCGDPYKIFFEFPDPTLPATATLWNGSTVWLHPSITTPTLSNFTFTPDGPSTRSGTFSFDVTGFTGQVQVHIDVNNDSDFDDPEDVTVPGSVTGDGTTTVGWDGLDGNGNPVAPTAEISAEVVIDQVGEIHFVNNDVERRGGLQVEALNGPNAGSTTLYWNDTQLLASGRCGTTPPLDGTAGVDSSGGAHGWSNTGCPSFGNANDGVGGSWGDARIIDDWTYQTTSIAEVLDISASPSADLAITKSVVPTTVTPSGPMSYTLEVVNNGPDEASNVSVTDTLPSGTTFVSATGDGWTCANNSGTVTCTRPTATQGAQPNIIITLTAPTSQGAIDNTATVTSDTFDSVDSNNTDDAIATVVAPAGNAFVCDGTPYIVGLNTGANSAQLWSLNTSAPPFTFDSIGSTSSGFELNAMGFNPADNLLYALELVNTGGSGFTVSGLVTIDATGAISDPVAINDLPDAAYFSGDIGSDGMLYVYAANAANMYKIDLTSHDATAIPLSQSLVIGDFAFSPADGQLYSTDTSNNVVMIDSDNGDVTIIPIASGTIAGTGGHYFAADGTLFAYGGGSHLYQIDLDASGGPAVISDNTVPGVARADAAACNAHTPSADLSIAKTDDPDPVGTNSQLTYTVQVTNHGPDNAAAGTVVTDTLPADVTFGSVDGGAEWACNFDGGNHKVNCTSNSEVALGAAEPITITVTTPATATDLTNSADVTSPTGDPDPDNNHDEITTTVTVSNLPVGVCTGSGYAFRASGLASPTTMFQISPEGTTINTVATIPYELNSVGYNQQDGYLYALRRLNATDGFDTLVRISPVDGSYEVFDTPVQNAPTGGFIARAAMRGNLMYTDAGDTFYTIDVTKNAVVGSAPITPSGSLAGSAGPADYAYNPFDGFIYGFGYGATTSRVIKIDPTSGAVFTTDFPTPAGANGMGAQWLDGSGRLYGIVNLTNDLWRIDGIDTATPSMTKVNTLDTNSGGGDGASCTPPDLLKDVSPASAAPDDTVTYTYTVSNPTVQDLTGVTLSDPLPDDGAGRTFVDGSVTVTDQTGTTLSGYTASISDTNRADDTLTITDLTIPVGQRVTITVDVQIAADATSGEVTNQATLTDLPAAFADVTSDYPETGTVDDPTPLTITAGAWTCTAFGYLFQSPNWPDPGPRPIQQIDLATGAYTAIGETTDTVNAVGYNTIDNYMYGWDLQTDTLVRINVDGTLVDLGKPANTASGYIIGDFDDAGHLWLLHSHDWVEIDLSDSSAATYGTVINSGTLTVVGTGYTLGADWAFINGKFYMIGHDADSLANLVVFDPAANTVTDAGVLVGPNDWPVSGAVYADASGYLYASYNTNGNIYRINPVNRQTILVSNGPESQSNDGARCATAPIPTITVSKAVNGRADASDQFTVGLQDNTGTTLTSATTSGTDTTASTADWPVTQSEIYTITDAMAAGSASPLSNYISTINCTDTTTDDTVIPGGTAPNWTLAVTTTDAYNCVITNTANVANLVISKSASPASGTEVGPGQPVTYTLTFDNSQGSADATVPAGYIDTLTDVVDDATVTTQPALATGSGLTVGSITTIAGVTTFPISGTVPAGTIATVTYTVTVNDPDTGNGVLANFVSEGPPPSTTCAGQPTCTTNPISAEADLTLSKTGPATVGVNGTVSYRITVVNNGPGAAENAQVTDALPSGLSSVSVQTNMGSCTQTSGTLICDLGTIANGGLVTILVTGIAPNTAQQLSNTARVTSSTDDPKPDNNEDTVTTGVVSPPPAQADLLITKSGPASVGMGATVSYSIVATNNGPDAAENVQVTDLLPTTLINVTATPEAGTCAVNGDTLNCDLGTLQNGASIRITVTGTAPDSAQQLTNSVNITSDTSDPNPDNNEDRVTTNVVAPPPPSADLSITKDGPASVTTNGQVSYTLIVTNDGPNAAENATVTDKIPAGLSGVAASTSQGSCTLVGSTLTCLLGTIPNGGKVTISVVGTAPDDAGQLTNLATISSTTNDPDPNDNEDGVITDVTPPAARSADLVLEKNGPASVGVNGVVSYTITVTNNGPDDASNVMVTDDLPTGLTSVSVNSPQGTCSQSIDTITCNLGTIANGGTVIIRVTGTAPDTVQTLLNIASVSSNTPDPKPGNNEDTVTTGVENPPPAQADLELDKSGPASVSSGGQVTYTITVTNNGPDTAENARVIDALPSGLTGVSYDIDDGTCTRTGPTLICTIDSIESGAKVRIQVTGTAPATSGQLVNTASVTSDTEDPDPGNNDDTVTTGVTPGPQPQADLVLHKTGPASVGAGGTVSYLISVTNNGPDAAENATVTDQLPDQLTNVSVQTNVGTCSVTGATVTCDLGSLPSGSVVSIVVTGTAPDTAQRLSNTASVTSGTNDPDPGNNEETVTTGVENPPPDEADLTLDKSGPASVSASGQVTYTITVTNNGPDAAENVQVTDQLPTELTSVTTTPDSGTCSQAGSALTCDLGTIENGGQVKITVVGTAPATAQQLTNNASVTSDTNDPDPNNNEDTVTTGVFEPAPPSANLVLDKSGPAAVTAGGQVSYTITVTNNGPDAAENAVVTDSLPAGLLAVTATPSQGTCSQIGSTLTCQLGTLANGDVVTIGVIGTAPATAGTLENTATTTSTTEDPDPSNNEDGVTTRVTPPPAKSSDLVIDKSGPTSVEVGGTVSYTITVTNNGPDDASNAIVTDDLPTALTDVSVTSSQGTCNQAGMMLTCTLGTIANGGTVTIRVTGTAPDTAQSLTNTASVTSDTGDPDPDNNEDTVTTGVVNPPAQSDLDLDKSGPASVSTSGTVSYLITVTNNGPDAAVDATVTDQLPSGLTHVVADPSQGSCNLNGTTLSCNLGTLASGAGATITVTGTAPDAAGSLTNTASVTTTTEDPDPGNNTDGVTTTVTSEPAPEADLNLTKTGPATVASNGTVDYTIKVTNDGPDAAENATVTEHLPTALTDVSVDAGQGTCNLSGSTITCDLGTIASGGSVTISVSGVAPESAQQLTNSASVTSDTNDPDPNDNHDEVTTTVTPQNPAASADLEIEKVGPATVTVNGSVTYTITVTNNGPDAAQNATVTEQLPSGLTDVAATSSQGSCSPNGSTLTCNLGTIPSDGIVTISVSGTAPDSAQQMTNSASITSDASDPDPGDNNDSVTTTVITETQSGTTADLVITKTSNPNPATAGGPITYTITVTNNGPDAATGVEVKDSVPSEVQNVTFTCSASTNASCDQSSGSGNEIDLMVDLANGSSVTITVNGTLAADASGTVTNTATLTVPDGVTDTNPSTDASVSTGTQSGSAPGGPVTTPPTTNPPATTPPTKTPTVTLPGGLPDTGFGGARTTSNASMLLALLVLSLGIGAAGGWILRGKTWR